MGSMKYLCVSLGFLGCYLSILGDDIFRTLERIESNKPYYTTLMCTLDCTLYTTLYIVHFTTYSVHCTNCYVNFLSISWLKMHKAYFAPALT